MCCTGWLSLYVYVFLWCVLVRVCERVMGVCVCLLVLVSVCVCIFFCASVLCVNLHMPSCVHCLFVACMKVYACACEQVLP